MPALKEGLPVKRQLDAERVMPKELLTGSWGGGPPIHPAPSSFWPDFSPSTLLVVFLPLGLHLSLSLSCPLSFTSSKKPSPRRRSCHWSHGAGCPLSTLCMGPPRASGLILEALPFPGHGTFSLKRGQHYLPHSVGSARLIAGTPMFCRWGDWRGSLSVSPGHVPQSRSFLFHNRNGS